MRKLNKTQFDFFKKDGKIYMQQLITADGLIILKQMFGYGQFIAITKTDLESYTYMDEDDVYMATKSMPDDEYHHFMELVGAYVCPFCGGHIHWENDFMTSEVRGIARGYYKITDIDRIHEMDKKKDEYISSNMLQVVDDIRPLNDKVEQECTYDTMYVYDGTDYWEIDDPVIGIYTCSSCGKQYEVQDPYEHEIEIDDYYE